MIVYIYIYGGEKDMEATYTEIYTYMHILKVQPAGGRENLEGMSEFCFEFVLLVSGKAFLALDRIP